MIRLAKVRIDALRAHQSSQLISMICSGEYTVQLTIRAPSNSVPLGLNSISISLEPGYN